MSLEWSERAEVIFQQIKEMERDHLYVVQASGGGPVKVGRSVRPCVRLRQLQTASPVRLRLIRVHLNSGHREHLMHRMLAPLHIAGEWFHPSALLLLDEIMPFGEVPA